MSRLSESNTNLESSIQDNGENKPLNFDKGVIDLTRRSLNTKHDRKITPQNKTIPNIDLEKKTDSSARLLRNTNRKDVQPKRHIKPYIIAASLVFLILIGTTIVTYKKASYLFVIQMMITSNQ